ncbi:MAG: hypothetical protein GC171_00330 [Terrimonas sp.]|nr:hypothetical protein [Terrimonas sp.]
MKRILIIITVIGSGLVLNAQQYRSVQFVNPEQKLAADYCSPLFQSADGTIISVADKFVGSYLNILDWLNGRVAGLQVIRTREHVFIPYIRGSVASLFVDEMRVEPEFLNSINPNDIALIKIIKGPFVGSPGGNSAIAIYTLRGFED